MSMVSVTDSPVRREEDVPPAPRSYWGDVYYRFVRNWPGVTALAVLLCLIAMSIFAPLLTRHDPLVGNPNERLRPIGSAGHVLGTDEQGRDMLARLLYGGRLSLIAGIAPVSVALVLGTGLGATAAFVGGMFGTIVMRMMDMFYAFPAILLAIAIGASLGPGLQNVIIALAVVYTPPIARVAESATRKAMVNEYIEAARLTGAGTLRLISHEVLANIFSPVFVYASSLVGVSILVAASLSFLGLGSKPPTPEWGYMLNSLRASIYVNPWVVALPGVFISVTSIAFNTLSDAIRDAMDIKATTS
jgi:peptide/nickel transport system permease protein